MKVTVEMDANEFEEYMFYKKLDQRNKKDFRVLFAFNNLEKDNKDNYTKEPIIETIKIVKKCILRNLDESRGNYE